ncbi:MAG: 4Fe-4S binding protein [Firmicutes bacterium]|nr:4Fe-4S binding protein [Bacillota bacterium]
MNTPKFDLAAYKKVGMIQQKQAEYFVMRLHAVGGDFTTAQIQKVADVAQKYGRGEVHLSTRQGIEIHYVHYSNLEKARQELKVSGIEMGACGPRIRIVVACPGAATCRWGIIDTKPVARYLDEKYFRQDTPYKFKMAVTGCPHNCAKATENDLGIMGGILPEWRLENCSGCDLCLNSCPVGAIAKENGEYRLDETKCIYCSICTSNCPMNSWKVAKKGYILWIGGTMGKVPRLATRLKSLIETETELYQLVENIIDYYRQNGRKRERFGHMIDRLGEAKVKEEILHGKRAEETA